MIARDAEPIGNRPVYKRVDLAARQYGKTNVRKTVEALVEALVEAGDRREIDRIWRHVVQSASGSAPPAPAAPEPAVIDYTQLDQDFYG